MQRRDVGDRIRLVPNDAASILAVTHRVDPVLASRTIIAIDSQDQISTGAQAISRTVASTGGFLGALARIFALRPFSLLLEPGYRLFARHRGRLARFFPGPE